MPFSTYFLVVRGGWNQAYPAVPISKEVPTMVLRISLTRASSSKDWRPNTGKISNTIRTERPKLRSNGNGARPAGLLRFIGLFWRRSRNQTARRNRGGDFMSIQIPQICIRNTGTEKGRGAFALRAFASGEVIEVCPVIVFTPSER